MGLKRRTSWKDFWDPSYDAKRGIYVIGNTLGINFLFMADKIYGKDYFDVDAGIAAIKKLNAKMVDFTGTIEKHLQSKEVSIAVLHDGSTTTWRSVTFRWTGWRRKRACRSSTRSSRSRAAARTRTSR